MTIYERIKELRIQKNMSQQELASLVGYVGRSAISKVENGERDISQSMIVKYASALGVTPTFLLYGEELDTGVTVSPGEYVVFHRNGKNLKVKFNDEQKRIFDALIASAELEEAD